MHTEQTFAIAIVLPVWLSEHYLDKLPVSRTSRYWLSSIHTAQCLIHHTTHVASFFLTCPLALSLACLSLCLPLALLLCPSFAFRFVPDFALCTAQVLQEPGVSSRQLRTRAKAVKKLGTIFSQVNRARNSPVINIMEEFSEVLQAS